MAKKYDGDGYELPDDFPVKKTNRKSGEKREQQVGEANPNSRAARWLREAAAKPKMDTSTQKEVIPDETEPSPTDEDVVSLGQVFDGAFQGLADYVSSLEQTLLETYKRLDKLTAIVESQMTTIELLSNEVSGLRGMQRDLMTLQSVVLAMQNSQRVTNYSSGNVDYSSVAGDINRIPPDVVRPTTTGDIDYTGVEPFFVSPPLNKDQFDK